jgi:hypothetical protein
MSQTVLVCGGRDYINRDLLWAILDCAHTIDPIETLVSGMARGADTLAANWASKSGIPVAAFPADWKRHGKQAGPIRNQEMIDKGEPDIVLAFPGGVGTKDMVRRAERAGIPVVEFSC